MRRWIQTALFVGVALVATSCDGGASGLVVDLRTDLVPGLEFESVRSELTRADDPAAARSDMLGAAGLGDALAGARVAEWNDVAPGTWLVVVRLLDASGAEIVSGRVLTDLTEGTRAVTVMITRDCVGVVCGDGLTCVDGDCIDPRCSPESPDECPTRCASDSECTASGPTCVVGRCLDGTCFEAADDAACGSGASCNPMSGCVGGVDAGPFDAGSLDGGLDGGTDAGPFMTELRDAVEVASGNDHSCARLSTGAVMCWGSNSDGQLGDGTTTDRRSAVPVMGLTDAVELALGEDHSCARRASGRVSCWGDGLYGQLGDGLLSDSATPVVVSGLTNVVSITAGWDHSCAVIVGDQGRCWGRGDRGQRFDGSTVVNGPTPSSFSGVPPVAGIAGGQIWACMWTTGDEALCAGNNFYGQLGNAMTGSTSVPQSVIGLSGTLQMGLGFGHTCARTTAGIRCWGLNEDGQLGDGSTADRTSPGPLVSGLTAATDLSIGRRHSCAVVSNLVRCWGFNDDGQLGDGTTTARSLPVSVPGVRVYTQVAAGYAHTCALGDDGTVQCWGANGEGQVGAGTMAGPFLTPTPVMR